MAALGYPLPVTVIAEMLGVRPRDLDLFKGWSNVLALSVNAILTTEEIRAIKQAADEAYAYFETIIDERRRQPREDVEIGGRSIRAGKRVVAIIGAANRDPEVFDDPDTLDIGRAEKSHLAFGRGIHYCLGAALAVLEARVAFASLLDRFPSIRLAAEPRYRDNVVLRGLDELWIEVERA